MAAKKKDPPNITHANGFIHFREPYLDESGEVPEVRPGRKARVRASTIFGYNQLDPDAVEIAFGIGQTEKADAFGTVAELDAALMRASIRVNEGGQGTEPEA